MRATPHRTYLPFLEELYKAIQSHICLVCKKEGVLYILFLIELDKYYLFTFQT